MWQIRASDGMCARASAHACAHSVGVTDVHRLPLISGARNVLQVRHRGLSVAWSDEQREGVRQRRLCQGTEEESCKDARPPKEGRALP